MDSPAVAAPAPSRAGKYGPLVHIARFDLAAEELTWQLPVNGELYKLLPGPDRPDYSLMVLRRPLHFYPGHGSFDMERVDPAQRIPDRKGRPMVRVHALVVCARFAGQQLEPGMVELPVHVAHVIDNSLARDDRIDFAKLEFAGAGLLSEGHAERLPPSATQRPGAEGAAEVPPEATGRETEAVEGAGADVAREAAIVLRRGIEDRRGSSVGRLSATFSLGEGHRVTGLTGNADGQPPEPTAETFERLNRVFARLGEHPATAQIRSVRVRLGEGSDEIEVSGA